MAEHFAPHITDPDSDDVSMTADESRKAAKIAAILFPELIDHSQDKSVLAPRGRTIMGRTLAQWAVYIAATDITRIDTAIRTGIIAGMDSTEIARKVIGSAGVNGMDGVTEFTRKQITNIGRAEIKSLIARGK